jgi:hypothetical protein
LDKFPKPTRTGKKSKVAGMECEDWEFKDEAKNQKALVCIAEQDSGWLKFPTKALPDQIAWAAELLDGKHLPLRFIAFKGDKEEGRLEASRIEKKTMPDASFVVPAGYQTMDLMQMLKGGMGGMGGMGGPGYPGYPGGPGGPGGPGAPGGPGGPGGHQGLPGRPSTQKAH